MRLIGSILIILFLNTLAYASTNWYVRDGGGTPTQCTGTTNAVYPGSGTAQPCALSHPAWALGTPIYCTNPGCSANPSTPAKVASGDTLFIVGDSDINPGQQAQYMIGVGMPNVTYGAQCGPTGGGDAYCFMAQVAPGVDSTHLTKIIGIGTNKPQLWGTAGVYFILDITGGNYDIENLEITQHSSCSSIGLGSSNPPSNGYPAFCGGAGSGTWAFHGIEIEGNNITTANNYWHNISNAVFDFPGNVSN